MEKLDELKIKLAEVDRLIGNILDSEPESEHGKYGKEIGALFQDMSWIDFCCITESGNSGSVQKSCGAGETARKGETRA